MTIQYSRINPPKVLIPMNYNAVGSHNELLPNTDYKPESSKKSIIHQRQTKCDDLNKAKETPFHPPYMNYCVEYIQGASNNTL